MRSRHSNLSASIWSYRQSNHEEALLPLIDVTQGNPLAIKLALGYVRALGLEHVIKRFTGCAGGSIDDVFKRLFSWSWDVMSKEARDLLMVTSFFADDIEREALRKVSGLTSDSLNATIIELVGLMLLDNRDPIVIDSSL